MTTFVNLERSLPTTILDLFLLVFCARASWHYVFRLEELTAPIGMAREFTLGHYELVLTGLAVYASAPWIQVDWLFCQSEKGNTYGNPPLPLTMHSHATQVIVLLLLTFLERIVMPLADKGCCFFEAMWGCRTTKLKFKLFTARGVLLPCAWRQPVGGAGLVVSVVLYGFTCSVVWCQWVDGPCCVLMCTVSRAFCMWA
jgi:hypothetical protein